MTQVTLQLPDEVWERARKRAQVAHCTIEELFVRQFERPISDVPAAGSWDGIDFVALGDDQLLVLIRAVLPTHVQGRLSELLERNGEGSLTTSQRRELDGILALVHSGTLLRARALLAWKQRHGSLPPGIDTRGLPDDAAAG